MPYQVKSRFSGVRPTSWPFRKTSEPGGVVVNVIVRSTHPAPGRAPRTIKPITNRPRLLIGGSISGAWLVYTEGGMVTPFKLVAIGLMGANIYWWLRTDVRLRHRPRSVLWRIVLFLFLASAIAFPWMAGNYGHILTPFLPAYGL